MYLKLQSCDDQVKYLKKEISDGKYSYEKIGVEVKLVFYYYQIPLINLIVFVKYVFLIN